MHTSLHSMPISVVLPPLATLLALFGPPTLEKKQRQSPSPSRILRRMKSPLISQRRTTAPSEWRLCRVLMQRLSSVVSHSYVRAFLDYYSLSLHRALLRSRSPLPARMKQGAAQRAAQRATSSVRRPWRVGRTQSNRISSIATFTSCIPGPRQRILGFVLRSSGTGDLGIPIPLILRKAETTYNW